MRAADFAEETVGAQQAELAADGGGAPATLVVVGWTSVQQCLEVSVAQTVDEEVAPADYLQQDHIRIAEWAKRPMTPMMIRHGPLNVGQQLFQARVRVHCRQSVEIPLIGGLTDFSPPM